MTMVNKKIWAIIPAAGSGARFGKDKIWHLFNNKPILYHTLRVFLENEFINGVVVVVNAQQKLDGLPPHDKIIYCHGGSTRSHSVINGLNSIADSKNNPFVIVHDGARANLTPADLQKVIDWLMSNPAQAGCALGIPIRDAVKKVIDSKIVSAIARDNLWQIFTPQATHLNLLKKALGFCQQNNIFPVDESQALEAIGQTFTMLLGNPFNVKITYPQDLEIMQKVKS